MIERQRLFGNHTARADARGEIAPGRQQHDGRMTEQTTMPRLDAEYVLPIRRRSGDPDDGLCEYLRRIVAWLDVTVVDGSDDDVFERNAAHWPPSARHVRPDSKDGANGKVLGVMTGLRLARHEAVIIADDDVRYTRPSLERVLAGLRDADVVRPQNYFLRRTWHTQWDTARTLVNRGLGCDYPGTLGVRRSRVISAGGYSADVLFENLELLRTVRAAGGTEYRADDLFVGRTAPTVGAFFAQRVRQAYDDFAQPARLVAELSLLGILAAAATRPAGLGALLGSACLVAAVGRAKADGAQVFPASSVLWAPVWVLERSVCVWLAVGERLLGGARYRGGRVKLAATPQGELRRRLAGPRQAALAGGSRTSCAGEGGGCRTALPGS